MLIRDETSADIPAIAALMAAAFETLAVSQHTEPFIIAALRAAGALTISRVAEDGQVVGHLAFSPVRIGDGSRHWYGLGPLSVWPARQRQGIGTALMEDGLDRLRRLGAAGCVLVGHPAFYRRFGFRNFAELVLPGVPPEIVLALPLGERLPRGTVTFHAAFLAQA